MSRKIILSLSFALLAAGALAPARADSWSLPKREKYYSPDKKYYLEVTPKKLESQLKYFGDKVEGREDAGARKDAKGDRARGAFYARRADGGYSKRREFPLVNEVSPVNALVSGDGDYVVTFDNWHAAGYGDDVVVIYRTDGALIKKFGLGDLLTEGDIEALPHSVSSIWWGGEHYLDEARGLVVLRVGSRGQSPREQGAAFHELRIELATGRPLEPKRDLFPQPRVLSSAGAGAAPETPAAHTGQPTCSSKEESFDSPGAVRIPPEQFYAKAKARPLPPYPPIAKAARVWGTVVVEALVSGAGEVVCARALSGHPLLIRAATAAALKWKFEPIEVSGNPVRVIGTIDIDFRLAGQDMNHDHQPRHR